jgi:16S rRNA (guanine(527)-N(7))-methyltransferase RsmG
VAAPLSLSDFRRLTGVSRETADRLEAYSDLLERWQRRINLVSTASLGDRWRRHFLDAAQLVPLIAGPPRRIADIGSGAGFPGLVLALMGAGPVDLIESDGRKCAFLSEAVRITGAPARVIHGRAEEATLDAPAEVITARGFGPIERILDVTEPIAGPETIYLLPRGRNASERLTDSSKQTNMRIERYASITEPGGVILRLTEVWSGPFHAA